MWDKILSFLDTIQGICSWGHENKEFPTFSDPQFFLLRLKSRSNKAP